MHAATTTTIANQRTVNSWLSIGDNAAGRRL
jgi:hypothetical protein